MKNKATRLLFVFMGVLILIGNLLDFLSSGNPSNLVISSIGIILILSIIYGHKDFGKIFLLTLLGLIAFSGLILTYIYLFKPIYIASFPYYLATGVFVVLIIMFAYYYLQRHE